MTDMSKEAMKLALEALEDLQRQYAIYPNSFWDWSKGRKAITALREALAQERSSDEQPEPSCPECVLGLCHCGLRKAEQPAQQKPVADEVRCSMSTQHTPGPWLVKDTDFGVFVYCDHDYPITGPMNARSDGDNARLIAAAPDLIELLQTMPHPERRTGITHLTDEWCEWNAKRRAAIAKAEGIKENA